MVTGDMAPRDIWRTKGECMEDKGERGMQAGDRDGAMEVTKKITGGGDGNGSEEARR